MVLKFGRLVSVGFAVIGCVTLSAVVAMSEPVGEPEGSTGKYSNEAFLEAVHANCAEVQNREPRSCQCEQKLIDGDRLTDDEKQMTFYYYTDKDEFKKRYEAKKAADPKWPAAFSQRFTNLQALLISACGK